MKESVPIKFFQKKDNSNLNIKSLFFLFIIYILISTSQCTDSLIQLVPNTGLNRDLNMYGIGIKGIVLVLLFILVNYLNDCDIL